MAVEPWNIAGPVRLPAGRFRDGAFGSDVPACIVSSRGPIPETTPPVMTSLYAIVVRFARQRPSPVVRYVVTLSLIAAMTFVRFLAPAYVAPFLLYIPVLLAVSLAFGRGPAILTLVLSSGAATAFYLRDGS